MNDQDLLELCTQIEADLKRAEAILPLYARNDRFYQEYQSFLEHNELALACEALECYGEENEVEVEFWLALCDAAAKMELQSHVELYSKRARGGGSSRNSPWPFK